MSGANDIAPLALTGKSLEEFVVRGNLAALSPADKAAHYIQLCASLGLNPATKPFEFLTLQGKETLYARRDCTDQLRKLHNVSIAITGRERVDEVYIVTAMAHLPDGRCDESTGVVAIGGLKGEALANKLMACETKAKRRVTLSIVGLGMLDESELDTVRPDRFEAIPQEAIREAPKQKQIERKTEKPGEALPEIPATIGMIPVSILLAHHKRLSGLDGVRIADMQDDDLDLVIATMRAAYAVEAPAGRTSQHGLDWYKAIAERAKAVLTERSHPAPPPNDADAPGEA